jgi:hypothetical protein
MQNQPPGKASRGKTTKVVIRNDERRQSDLWLWRRQSAIQWLSVSGNLCIGHTAGLALPRLPADRLPACLRDQSLPLPAAGDLFKCYEDYPIVQKVSNTHIPRALAPRLPVTSIMRALQFFNGNFVAHQ